MRALLQRVKEAAVRVEGKKVGEIGHGLVVLVGVRNTDTEEEAAWMANKIAGLRIFEDDEGKMNRSVQDVNGAILVVSQFTLYGDARKGRRPSFTEAAPPKVAELLVESFTRRLRDFGLPVATGVFGARMQLEIHNDGPVTIMLNR